MSTGSPGPILRCVWVKSFSCSQKTNKILEVNVPYRTWLLCMRFGTCYRWYFKATALFFTELMMAYYKHKRQQQQQQNIGAYI